MATTLKAQMAEDLINVIMNTTEGAEASKYTPVGATQKNINAIWRYDNFLPDIRIAGEFWEKQASVLVSRADVNSPTNGDLVQNAAGEIFEVKNLESQNLVSSIVNAVLVQKKTVGQIRGNK